MSRLPCGLVLLLAQGAAGCAGPACPVYLHTDAARVLTGQTDQVSIARTLRAEATVDQRGPDGRVRGKVMMFLARPAHVRFDAVTQFGPALVLTSDGGRFALSDFKQGRFFTGPACARNIARMIGVAMSAEEVVSVLLGDVPRLPDAQTSIQCSNRGGYRIDESATSGVRQEIEFAVHEDDFGKQPAKQRLRLTRAARIDAQNRPLWRVTYGDYRAVGGRLALPFRVHVEDLSRGSDAVVRFAEIDVDVVIPQGAFSQTARPGLTVEDVTCE